MIFNSITQYFRAIGCWLSDLVLWSISWLSHLIIHLNLLVFACIWIKSRWAHGIISSQVWLINILNILRLANNIICVILSTDKALSTRRMRLTRCTGRGSSCLFIHWDLLCVVSIEKVHTGVGASRILVIDSIRWLYKLTILGYHSSRCHLLICLSLSLIAW
jgi:hypothetical protein